ncbi:MAG: hypothetical protein ACI3Z0_05355 [Candidatus Cryptobacteroides sp.]
MMSFITSAGEILDLSPDTEFEIEYDNPLFEDERMPVPFSTSISFPVTETNCKVFGYLPMMMLPPAERKVDVTIEVFGIPIFRGRLEYDSIDDGKPCYTFTGAEADIDWSKKLWELKILSYKESEASSVIASIVAGEVDGITAPLLTNKAMVAESIYKDDAESTGDTVSSNEKYRNCPIYQGTNSRPSSSSGLWGFTPVISFRRILSAIPGIWSKLPDEPGLSIIGSPAVWKKVLVTRYLVTTSSGASDDEKTYEIADRLPDVSISDFVGNLAKMICGSVYYDGGRLAFVGFDDIIASTPANWEGKIAEGWTAGKEESSAYKLSYTDSAANGNYDEEALAEDYENGTLAVADNLGQLISFAGEDFTPILYGETYDVYSIRRFTSGGKTVVSADVILHNAASVEDEGSDNVYDCTMDFILPYCIPETLYKDGVLLKRMSPVIEFPASGDDRTQKMYIGYSAGKQFTDTGSYFKEDGSTGCVQKGGPQFASLLGPHYIYERYHSRFAAWLATERQTISADLNLSPMDINEFRMFRPVYFSGRRWIVRSLRLRFNAGSESIESSGEFISLDDPGVEIA